MENGFVRSASFEGFCELIGEMGGDYGALLQQAGIEPIQLLNPDTPIAASKLCCLLEISARQQACPNFGLHLAQKQGLSILGVLADLAQQAANLSEALEALGRYFHLHSRAGEFEFEVVGKLACLRYQSFVDYQGQNRQLVELTIAVGLEVLRAITGQRIKPKGIYFSHSAPQELSLHHQLFKVPLAFDWDFNGLTLDAEVLQQPLPHSSERVKQLLQQHFNTLEQQSPLSFIADCRSRIRNGLLAGDFKLASIAAQFELSPRTLQRRLKEEGSSFQTVLDEQRQELSLVYLRESSINLTELSQRLGFADNSAFSKSFKRWFGQTPRSMIRSQRLRPKLR